MAFSPLVSILMSNAQASRMQAMARALAREGVDGVEWLGAEPNACTAMRRACGKYVAFLDAEASFELGALSTRLRYLESHSDVALVHSPTRLYDATGNDLCAAISRPRAMAFEAAMNPVDLNGVMVRSSLLRQIPPEGDQARHADRMLFARLLRTGAVSHFVADGAAALRLDSPPDPAEEHTRHEHAVNELIGWIYADDEGTHTASAYRQGLSSPPRTAARRVLELPYFIWGLVSGNVQICRDLMASAGFVAFLNAYTVVSLKEAVRLQAARQFQVNLKDAPTNLDRAVRARIVAQASELGLLDLAPSMMLALCECLEEPYPAATGDWISLQTTARASSDSALTLLTTFRTTGDPADTLNCTRIMLQNCGNAYLRAVHVLLEGDPAGLTADLSQQEADALHAHLAGGRLTLSPITGRPDYKTILDYANTLDAGAVAVTNADIIVPEHAARDIARERASHGRPVYALTRWNRTASGDYLQGLQAYPPWPQWPADQRSYFEKHCLSYDCYVFDVPLAVPPALATVSVATFGCDTAMAAIFRAAGHTVSNPCLSIRTVHVDDKLRDYSGERGQQDLATNVGAVEAALLQRYSQDPARLAVLRNMQVLSKPIAWLGGPGNADPMHTLFLNLGASPWRGHGARTPLSILEIVIDNGDLDGAADQISRVQKAVENDVFISWRLSGFPRGGHIADLLASHDRFEAIAYPLFRYQWQAMVHQDLAGAEAQEALRALQDVVMDVLCD